MTNFLRPYNLKSNILKLKQSIVYTKTKLLFFFLSAISSLIIFSSCALQSGRIENKMDDNRLKVVATTSMIADAVNQIAGDSISLYSMMGAGVDPHLYKPTKKDIDKIDQADLILYNGLYLEAKVAGIFSKMSSIKHTTAVAETIADSLLRYPSAFKGHPDPHVWFDVSLWKTVVNEIAGALCATDPKNKKYYENNLDAYLDSLNALNLWVKEQINTIPPDQRVMVTAHDAFGYFGIAYDMKVLGVQGVSTVTEAGLYDITKMIDLLTERKIKAVFAESSVSPKAIEAVVEGCQARGHDIRIGGTLFSDAMGTKGTSEDNFLGMVRYNINTIVNALTNGETYVRSSTD